jgi:hypothetical protein
MTATASFDFTAQQVTEETTKEYFFDMIPGRPSVILSPAHDSNPDFLDARLRRSIAQSEQLVQAPRGKGDDKLTPEGLKKQIEDDREVDRDLIARTCARAWGTPPVAVDGTTPPFSADNCYAFFKALPAWIFDPFRNFAGNLYNFVEQPAVDADKTGN